MQDGPDRPVGGLAVRAPAGVELRPAGRDDLDAVLSLLAERETVPAPDIQPETARARWDQIIGSVDASPYLAIADGATVGLLLLTFRRRLNFATWEAWVTELVVAPEFRRRGVGRALLRVAIEEWRLRGAHRISVELANREEAGAALLTGMGFEDWMLRFRQEPIRLDDRGGAVAPPDLNIRRIRDDDVDAVTRLVAEMGPRRSPVPDRMDAVRRSFREVIAMPGDRSIVAEQDGRLVGICTLETRGTLRTEAREAWIPELVVTEPMRGQGIGRRLLATALQTAADGEAGAAVLESGRTREIAQAMYRSRGFVMVGSVFTLLRDQ
jgi:ribosomal protein S18 acetylase RimI-like enzyme